MATRDFSKWRLSFAAGLCLLTGLRASAEDYAVGWYWLATSDTGKGSSSFTRANWLYENSGDPVAVSSGSKCYVPEGLTLFAGSGYSSFNVNLALDGVFRLDSTYGGATVAEVHLLPGGQMDDTCWNTNTQVFTQLYLESTESDPASIHVGHYKNLFRGTWHCSDPSAVMNVVSKSVTGRDREAVMSAESLALNANLADFNGKIVVGEELFVVLGSSSSTSYPGEFEISASSIISGVETASNKTYSFGRLTLRDGAELCIRVANNGTRASYVVTDRLTTVGDWRIGIRDGTFSLTTSSVTNAIRLVRLTGDAASSASSSLDLDRCELVGFDAVWEQVGPLKDSMHLRLLDNGDGTKDIALKLDDDVVMMKKANDSGPSATTSAFSDSTCWSTAEIPGATFDGTAVVCVASLMLKQNVSYSCDGLTLVMPNGSTFYNHGRSFSIRELYFAPGTTMMTYGHGVADQVLDGKVTIGAGASPVVFKASGGLRYIVNAGLSGSGDLQIGASSEAYDKMIVRLAGDNSDFAGRVSLLSRTTSYDPAQGTDNCSCLQLAGTNSLNGSYAGGAPWKALTVANYSKLEAMDDVALTNATRGVYVDGGARFMVPDGKTLSINQPLTLGGTLIKQGAGVLRLGGAVQFSSSGAEPTATPDPGVNNVIEVAEGAFAAGSLAGAQVSLAAGTSLSVDFAETDAGRIQRGTDFSQATFSHADATIPVVLQNATGEILQTGVFVAVCTVTKAQAAGLGLSFPRTSPKVLLDQRENADGTVTFLLGYRRQGLILTYR